jgi:hypothetical protein
MFVAHDSYFETLFRMFVFACVSSIVQKYASTQNEVPVLIFKGRYVQGEQEILSRNIGTRLPNKVKVRFHPVAGHTGPAGE